MAFLMLVVIVYGDCMKNSPSAMARMPVRVRFAIVGKVGEEFVLQNALHLKARRVEGVSKIGNKHENLILLFVASYVKHILQVST